MAKMRADQRGDNLGIEGRKFNWQNLIQLLAVGIITGSVSIGGVSFVRQDSTNVAKQVATNASDIRAEKLLLRSHIETSKATETLKNDNVKLQIKNIENQVQTIRDDQKEMKNTLKEILKRLPK